MTGTQQAAAAPDGGTFAKVDASDFVLHPREIPGVDPGPNGDQTARSVIESAEATRAVSKASPLSVAQSRQHTGRSLCHTTGINGALKYNGFCWDETDDNTSAYKNGWHPQGMTASHEAYESGTADGHHLYMQAWYYGVNKDDRDKKARVSILESTGKDWSYGHVLLVKPKGSRDKPDFTAVDQVHADGMVWYGNRLFVANGGELQIYDLNHLWKMKSVSERVGIENGVSSAGHHQWALPMVARYTTRTKAQEDASENKSPRFCGDPDDRYLIGCLSSLSLDRSSGSLVSGEYRSNSDQLQYENPPKAIDKRPARVITWPLKYIGEGGTSPVRATSAHVAPVRQLQGVATDGDYFYLSAECPVDDMGDARPGDTSSYSCIWQAKPGDRTSVLTRTPPLTQDLNYAPKSGRLWGSNEQTGKRVVFSLQPRRLDSAVYLSNDYSALCAGAGNKITNGSKVIQWGCTNAQDERWVFEDTTDSNGKPAYVLQNAYSGKCMGPASSLANGAGMIQYTCNGAVDQKWWYDPGTHELRNVYSGKCLGLGSNATKGSQLIQWTCNGAADEKWSKTAR
ncbi:ricin-type beta-trefoil lectin domain protein [Streptomyces sp. ISL-98]|uniref:RICIN domain-containing protein n=1 Tax=Streptomyces sp. ISL-98 TaxID=2819192 RepID=UPI001BE5A11C|nr:RICIN domain-containing protein [Streptomyces sp. ISL-98]MBT2511371.1 ricin-type beta-trefoil lectin domain protein [Streptomyces sp. ISL-98]